ncbi:hypothetical protein E3P86_00445 [Wallemia ichthyophaga]|uniref:Protein arginine methyltransferase NDUFAF7 n=1 Tax=Wallemia ichthyophaga TaxID=245174 RepID=A0A4V4M6T3_WALIC|nr:hypothetical protein E3P86_00445 [Wallemia ichthyophaga]
MIPRGWICREGILRQLNASSIRSISRRSISTSPAPKEEPTASPATSSATSLKRIIADSIKATGPIPVARYMSACTYHPTEGYYSRKDKDPISKHGDFITSPEISQIFGELIAVWFLHQWHALRHDLSHTSNNPPKKVRFVELGPGNGTLMADVLRTWQSFPTAWENLESVQLVETSPALRDTQKAALEGFGKGLKFHDRVQHIDKDESTFTFVLAHEFFDALPVHLFQKTDAGFREVLVDLINPRIRSEESEQEVTNENNKWLDGDAGFKYIVSKQQSAMSSLIPMVAPHIFSGEGKEEEGQRVELGIESYHIGNSIGQLLRKTSENAAGGCALFVDYGKDGWTGDTLRGFKNHQQVDVLSAPGECDITSDVDFGVLREALAHNDTDTIGSEVITQRDFLVKMGVAARLDTLLNSAQSNETKLSIASSAKRLLDVRGMGSQYKFMAAFNTSHHNRYPFI